MNGEIRLEPFNHIAALINAFARIQDDLQQSMAQLQEGVSQIAGQLAAGMAEYERVEGEAVKVLSQGSWCGMERHLTGPQVRSALEICKTNGEAAMNDAIAEYLNGNDCALLVAMTEEWARIPYLLDRQAIVRDAMSAHRAGQFTLSIPTLLPLAEGLCAEHLSRSETDVMTVLAKDLRSRGEIWEQVISDVVENVIYRYYKFGQAPVPDAYLNRNGILHGRILDYASKVNSTRVFLLIDMVAELWHAKRRTLSAGGPPLRS